MLLATLVYESNKEKLYLVTLRKKNMFWNRPDRLKDAKILSWALENAIKLTKTLECRERKEICDDGVFDYVILEIPTKATFLEKKNNLNWSMFLPFGQKK